MQRRRRRRLIFPSRMSIVSYEDPWVIRTIKAEVRIKSTDTHVESVALLRLFQSAHGQQEEMLASERESARHVRRDVSARLFDLENEMGKRYLTFIYTLKVLEYVANVLPVMKIFFPRKTLSVD
jgi:hypothetical protein